MQRQVSGDMWLVVHTPKTAGTSFRWALEKHFGKSNIVRDYGPQAGATSDVVREHLYSGDESKNPGTLVAEISDQKKWILIGHFYLPKYVDSFEAQNIIAFVRDPLVRMCSEYLHRLKNETFSGTFSEFVQKPGYQNMQSQFLSGISDDSFVGITEQYRESLRYINHYTQWNLSRLKKNVGRRGGGQRLAKHLSEEELELFYKINMDDVVLYKSAKRRFAALGDLGSTNLRFFNWNKHNLQK